MSTSIEHELAKRALESIPHVSSRSNPTLIPLPCFASNMPNTFSFLWFVCKHVDDITSACANDVPMIFDILAFCVATNMMKTCSFKCFVCTLHDVLDILPHVFLPNSPLIASRMLNNFSFRCFDCNNAHVFQHEIDTIVFSNSHGVFVFPHLEDVQTNCLHIDLAYALYLIYVCCANGVMNKNGHVMNDMRLYHTQKYFACSLLC